MSVESAAPGSAGIVRVFEREPGAEPELDELLDREWLVTNGLGGYASRTVSAAATRRYHGLLVAALPAPVGRMVMLSDVAETLELADGTVLRLGGEERVDALELHGARHLRSFRLEDGLPVWTYAAEGAELEKRLMMPHGQNSTLLLYRLRGAAEAVLRLRPLLQIRPHDAPVDEPLREDYRVIRDTPPAEAPGTQDPAVRLRVSAGADLPTLRLRLHGPAAAFDERPERRPGVLYRLEARRGYGSVGELWTPGTLSARLEEDGAVGLVASTADWAAIPDPLDGGAWRTERDRRSRLVAAAEPEARTGVAAELVLSADAFIVEPATRAEDEARARAEGEEARSIIAGYHWFTDWGRDTMISLEGLTLTTGRHREAGAILRTFARHVRDGLIPNLFPEGHSEGLYHTADATLWFFHALDRYARVTGDRQTLRRLRPVLHDIVRHHVRGTRFGIGVDPADGLLRQGAEGYQLTWMDAKVDGWVVTPRRGKAVEINALWYNALRALAAWETTWAREGGEAAAGDPAGAIPLEELESRAGRVREAFNARFWYEEGGHLYDVVDGEDGDDPAFRPNQVFAVSLPHPVLDRGRWQPVLSKVRERLLTPVGLRSLAPGHPDYKPTYHGDLLTRDAAYHQGTAWSWLIGPFVDAWLKLNPHDHDTAQAFLAGLIAHLDEAGLGTVSEVFDAEPPHHPRGCVAQAWGVAELLRCLVLTSRPPEG